MRVSVVICRARLGMRRAGKKGPPLNLETRGYKWKICWRMLVVCKGTASLVSGLSVVGTKQSKCRGF